MKKLIFTIIVISLLNSCYYDSKEDLYQFITENCDLVEVSYSNDIVPVLQAQCYSCHSVNNPEGGVILDSYDQTIISVNNGSLFGSMNHDAGYSIMPPSGQKVSQCDLDKLKLWIDNGALNN